MWKTEQKNLIEWRLELQNMSDGPQRKHSFDTMPETIYLKNLSH